MKRRPFRGVSCQNIAVDPGSLESGSSRVFLQNTHTLKKRLGLVDAQAVKVPPGSAGHQQVGNRKNPRRMTSRRMQVKRQILLKPINKNIRSPSCIEWQIRKKDQHLESSHLICQGKKKTLNISQRFLINCQLGFINPDPLLI